MVNNSASLCLCVLLLKIIFVRLLEIFVRRRRGWGILCCHHLAANIQRKIWKERFYSLSLRRECIKDEKDMARPIKETPILYGEDARRFEERMKEHRRVSQEERARIKANYEALIATANF